MTGNRMRFGGLLGAGIVAALVLLGLPLHAAAQFTLTGQLVEQIPGGGTPEDVQLTLDRVGAAGDTAHAKFIYACEGAATMDCVQSDGRFTVSDLLSGLYLVAIRLPWSNGTHMDKRFNATISGDTDVGVVRLVRAPFELDVTLGQIPSSGGSIPVTVRVQTRWDVPTLPLTASFYLEQWNTDGEAIVFWTPSIDFTWPPGLADSGVVALPPINVSPGAPAGARSCAFVWITLRNQPDVMLGRTSECRGKQP